MNQLGRPLIFKLFLLVFTAQVFFTALPLEANTCLEIITKLVPVPNGEPIELAGSNRVFFPISKKGQLYGFRLMQAALSMEGLKNFKRILVIGSGIGYDAVVLAKKSSAQIDAIDIDPVAVMLTEVNAQKHGLGTRINSILGNLFEGATGKYDLIIFNAPRPIFYEKYIESYVNYFRKTNTQSSKQEIQNETDALKEEAIRQYKYYIKSNPDLFDPEGVLQKVYLKQFPQYLTSRGSFLLMTEEKIPVPLPLGVSDKLLSVDDWGAGTEYFGIHQLTLIN